MFDLDGYLRDLIRACRAAFGDRLLYVGLQGSYQRGEAREGSDVDVMVILDRLSARDMDQYRDILRALGFYEKSCGFICGREEMARWNPLEVCQLRHTTKDLYGALADYLPPATREDEIRYVELSLGNLYHGICHRYIHADRDSNVASFRAACKSAFFLMQNLHYLESGRFLCTKRELMEAVSAEDRRVLELAELPDGFDFDQAFSVLFAWCQSAFARIGKRGRCAMGREAPAGTGIQGDAAMRGGVELRAIAEDNFLDAFHLRLAPGQERFVSHPVRSLAQAYVYREQCQPFGIYAEGKMIGYVMVIYDYDVPEYDVWHMMIDASMQGRGYGGAAMDRVLAYIRAKPLGDSNRVALTCNKDNPIARKLYESKGFAATGVEDDDEIELAMTIAAEREP